jgi:hypothetical protein
MESIVCKGCRSYVEKRLGGGSAVTGSVSGVVAAHKLFERGEISRAVYFRLLVRFSRVWLWLSFDLMYYLVIAGAGHVLPEHGEARCAKPTSAATP